MSRTNSFPLMSSVWPTVLLCLAYVYIVKVAGPRYGCNIIKSYSYIFASYKHICLQDVCLLSMFTLKSRVGMIIYFQVYQKLIIKWILHPIYILSWLDKFQVNLYLLLLSAMKLGNLKRF